MKGLRSGPLTETLKARFAARWERGNEGWQHSYFSPGGGNSLGEVNNVVARLLLDWEPVDALSVNVSLNGWKNKSDSLAGQYVSFNPQNDIVTGAFGGLAPVANFGPVLGPQFGVSPTTSLRQLVAPLLTYPFAPNDAQVPPTGLPRTRRVPTSGTIRPRCGPTGAYPKT